MWSYKKLSHCTTEEQLLKELSCGIDGIICNNSMSNCGGEWVTQQCPREQMIRTMRDIATYNRDIYTHTVQDKYAELMQLAYNYNVKEIERLEALPSSELSSTAIHTEIPTVNILPDPGLPTPGLVSEMKEAEEVLHIYHPHVLKRLPSSELGYRGRASCDSKFCSSRSIPNISYHCHDCGYDIHPRCVLVASKLPQDILHSAHEHVLEKIASESLSAEDYTCMKVIHIL